MKKSISIIFVLLILFQPLKLFATIQYVKLEGKQFKYSGSNFYPMVVNYGISICNMGAYYEISQLTSYGSDAGNNALSFSQGPARIHDDFKKIASMGFNAIRLIQSLSKPASGVGFTSDIFVQTNSPNAGDGYISSLNYSTPYISNFNLNNIFLPKIKELLDIAQSEGLKVIWLVGGGYVGKNYSNASDYADLLNAIANYPPIATHAALMAYDMYNEPHYTTATANTNCCEFTQLKSEFCEWTKLWYQALKFDTNHLITIGATGIGDVMDTDPAMAKVDFISEHIYPFPESFENYNDADALERIKGQLYWINKNVPLPWIIGETGFVASDINTLPSPYNAAPWVWGTEAQQSNYAQQVQQLALNYGCSGFSWWDFQNKHWFDTSLGPIKYNDNFFGLLNYGNPPNPGTSDPYPTKTTSPSLSIDKDVVEAGFMSNIPTSTSGPASQSTYYYAPYEFGSISLGTYNFNVSEDNSVIGTGGTVHDANTSLPIEDAVVFGWNWLETQTSPTVYIHSPIYTFTKSDGSFKLIPYNFKIPPVAHPNRIVHLRISAVGTEVKEFASSPTDWADYQMPTSPIVPDFTSHNFGYDIVVQNVTVNPGTKNFRGWKTLTATTNVTILSGATSDFTAGKTVDIQSEFNANTGSETHIFTSEFHECSVYTGYTLFRKSTLENVNLDLQYEANKDIEVSFIPKGAFSLLDLNPNPSTGLMDVNFRTKSSDPIKLYVQVLDLVGKIVYSKDQFSTSFVIDLSSVLPGIYYLRVYDGANNFVKKISIIH